MTIKNKPTRWQTSLLKGDAGCFSWRSISMWFWKRVIRCIHIFLSGVLWCNSGKVQEEGKTFCDPTEETNGEAWDAYSLISWISLRTKDCDLEHLCRTFEMWCLDAMYDFTNSKEDLRKLLAFKDFSTFKTRMLQTYNQWFSGRNCSASFSFHFSYVRSWQD